MWIKTSRISAFYLFFGFFYTIFHCQDSADLILLLVVLLVMVSCCVIQKTQQFTHSVSGNMLSNEEIHKQSYW
ncbi:hypothetical protein C0J52_21968 [Blattella germanica]|nr:hypothetical protein C0J52_21968 [Blattella germanica]